MHVVKYKLYKLKVNSFSCDLVQQLAPKLAENYH